MSYLNDQVGYREELLMTRSVIKKENYVLLEPDGLVKNSIPGYENCDVTILGSPAMGASFADYLVTAREGGKNSGIGGEGLENCHIKDFLPAAGDFGFDMNMHILKFKLGASHGYIETHVQEHGMYFLQGKGMYRVDDEWVPVKAGDYMFLDAYCPQACYAVGREEDFAYIYSKDCNRDVVL